MRTLRLAALAAACAFVFPVSSVSAMVLNTNDVQPHEFDRAAIYFLARHEIITGSPESGAFRPYDSITRAELLKIALEAAGEGRIALISTGSMQSSFSDVTAAHTLRPYILYAQANGYISGYEDGTFRPNANVSRAEAAKIVGNILHVPTLPPGKTYVDIGGTTLTPYIEKVVAANWYVLSEDHFYPRNPIRRHEVARMAYRGIVANAAMAQTGEAVPWSEALQEPVTMPSDWQRVDEAGLQFMLPAGWSYETASLTIEDVPMTALAASPFPLTEESIPVLAYMRFEIPNAGAIPEQAIQEAFASSPFSRTWINAGDGETMRQIPIYLGYIPDQDMRAAVWIAGTQMHMVGYLHVEYPGMDTTFLRSVQHALELTGM